MFDQPPNNMEKPKNNCADYVKCKLAPDSASVPPSNNHSTQRIQRTSSSSTYNNIFENNHRRTNKMQIQILQKHQFRSLKVKKNKAITMGGGGGIGTVLQTFLTRQFNVTNNHVPALFTKLQSKTIPLSLATKTPLTPQTPPAKIRKKSYHLLPGLGATSFFTLITLIFLEMILLSTVSNCAKTFYMHWNTSNSIFRIDNTDHIIDVNKGNLAFEFDQVHIICPVYEPGTFENETEKYIIYNVSKVEYETCRITNADPRVIAICDKPQKLMFFTITFRPFTPQPGGLEFLPGNDYYFISTSSKDDLYRRIGGRCSTNNMKVVFKVCCAPEEKNKTITTISTTSAVDASGGLDSDVSVIDAHSPVNSNHNHNQQQQHNNINSFGVGGINLNSPNGHNNNGIQLKPLNVGGGGGGGIGGSTGTSINTNIDQFNRIPMQTSGINVIGHNIGVGGGNNGILLTPGNHGGMMIPGIGGNSYHPAIGQYHPHPHQHPGGQQTTTGIRINNVPSQQQFPSHKHNSNNMNNNNNEDHYDKHPNEVVKNEELTYNSAGSSIMHRNCWSCWQKLFAPNYFYWKSTLAAAANSNSLSYYLKRIEAIGLQALSKFENSLLHLLKHPLVLLTVFFVVTIAQCVFLRSAKFKNNANTSSFSSSSSSFVPLPFNEEMGSKKQIEIDTNNSCQQQQQQQHMR